MILFQAVTGSRTKMKRRFEIFYSLLDLNRSLISFEIYPYRKCVVYSMLISFKHFQGRKIRRELYSFG